MRRRTLPSTGAALCALALAALAALAGCRGATPPMAFYTLAPAEEIAAPATGGPAVGVGPLTIPRSIDRPHIVTRRGANQLHLAEFHRWGAPLGDEILAALGRDLSALLGSEQVVAYPWANFLDPEYRVPVDILRLDGSLGGEVVLDATWGVAGPGQRKAGTVHTLHAVCPVEGDGYPALVAAHNAALARLAEAIAEEINIMRAAK